jgi:hypothetical protein
MELIKIFSQYLKEIWSWGIFNKMMQGRIMSNSKESKYLCKNESTTGVNLVPFPLKKMHTVIQCI